MDLTLAEFCSFNLQSRTQLIEKDGTLLAERSVYSKYKIRLYKIYRFYTEMVIDIPKERIVGINPIINQGVFDLYNIH